MSSLTTAEKYLFNQIMASISSLYDNQLTTTKIVEGLLNETEQTYPYQAHQTPFQSAFKLQLIRYQKSEEIGNAFLMKIYQGLNKLKPNYQKQSNQQSNHNTTLSNESASHKKTTKRLSPKRHNDSPQLKKNQHDSSFHNQSPSTNSASANISQNSKLSMRKKLSNAVYTLYGIQKVKTLYGTMPFETYLSNEGYDTEMIKDDLDDEPDSSNLIAIVKENSNSTDNPPTVMNRIKSHINLK